MPHTPEELRLEALRLASGMQYGAYYTRPRTEGESSDPEHDTLETAKKYYNFLKGE